MTCLYPPALLTRLRDWWWWRRRQPCRHDGWALKDGCPRCGKW